MSTRSIAEAHPSVRNRKAFLGRALRKLNPPGRHHPSAVRLVEPGHSVGGIETADQWGIQFRFHHDSLKDWHCFEALKNDPASLSDNDLLREADRVAEYANRSLSADRAPWVLVGFGAGDDRYPGDPHFVYDCFVNPDWREVMNPHHEFTDDPARAKLFDTVADARTMMEILGGPRVMVEPRAVF